MSKVDVLRAVERDDLNALELLAQQGLVESTAYTSDERTLMHIAAQYESIRCLEWLLGRDADGQNALAKDVKENTPLAVAAKSQHHRAVRKLLDHAIAKDKLVDAFVKNQDGLSPLFLLVAEPAGGHSAIDDEFEETFRALVNAAPQQLLRERHPVHGGTILHAMAGCINWECDTPKRAAKLIRWLATAKKISVNTPDKEGNTPLFTLLKSSDAEAWVWDDKGEGWMKIVKCLVSLGADLNHHNIAGENVLHALLGNVCLTHQEPLACLEFLVQKCSEDRLNEEGGPDGLTPLRLLARSCTGQYAVEAFRCVADKLDFSMDSDEPDKHGRRLWHSIASIGIAEHVINSRCGDDTVAQSSEYPGIGHKDKMGRTVLHAAAMYGDQGLVTFYISKSDGVKEEGVDTRDNIVLVSTAERSQLCTPFPWFPPAGAKDGNTPLHLAFSDGSRCECVRELLQFGADPLAVNKDGSTPLEESVHFSARDGRTLLGAAAEKTLQDSGSGDVGSSVITRALQKMREAQEKGGGKRTDVTLVCGGEELRCHALVLAAQGDYWDRLCYGDLARPDGRYVVEGLSADTLGTVLDYAYTGQLPSRLSHIPDLIAVMRAANRFIMPQLLAACRIRLMGTMEPEETDVFELYDAAKEIRDEQTAAMVERYVMREPNAQWLQGLADDSVAWGQLAKPGSASSELLRQTMVNLLREKSNKRQKTS